MKCQICKRPLSDIDSIRIGMGPVCRAHYGIVLKNQGELMFDNHAVFSIANETDSFVYIIDRNEKNKKSVTNDAAWVLSELYNLVENFDNKRVFYMDSEGQVDEIIHTGKSFVTFKAGHEGVTL